MLTVLCGGGQGSLFVDFQRFFAEIPQNARIFMDAWNGVRPMASRIVTSVHSQATGEYKTAQGPTRAFGMDCGVGIGCIIAPSASGPFIRNL